MHELLSESEANLTRKEVSEEVGSAGQKRTPSPPFFSRPSNIEFNSVFYNDKWWRASIDQQANSLEVWVLKLEFSSFSYGNMKEYASDQSQILVADLS